MSRIIAKESSAATYQRWELPMVEDVSGAVAKAKEDRASGLLSAKQIERIQSQAYKEAYDAGYAKGHKEGITSGEAEVNRKIRLLNDLLKALSQPFKQLDDDVEQELVGLALAIARQLVRRELKADPAQVVGVVHEALSVLPIGSRDVRVCLHPEDVKVMRDTLSQLEPEQNWSLVDDPGLMRGDCRILTETSQVEASLERRLAAVVSQIFGGDRNDDNIILPTTDDIAPEYPPGDNF